MRKLNLACLMLSCLFLSGLVGCAPKVSSPQYKGFPVYPPEQMEKIKENGNQASFQLSIRNRDRVITELKKTMGKQLNEETWNKSRELGDRCWKEFKNAENYIKTNATKLGWKIINEGMYRDDGSQYFLFAQRGKKIKLVEVTIWSHGGGVGCSAAGCYVDEKEWGYIDYEYTESDLPPEYKGFPLLLGTKGLKEYKKSATNEGTIFELSHDPMRDSEKTMTKFLFRIMEGRTKIPELYGWKLKLSPNIERDEALYEKNGKIVKVEGNVRFIFYSKKAAAKVAEAYPENVYKKEIANKGCLIFQGKYIRPPYVVEFKDNKVVVNGTIIDACPGYAPRQALVSFQLHVGHLEKGIEIGDGRGLGSRTPMSEGEIKDFITEINNIVKSEEPDSKKIENLRKLELLRSSPEDSLSMILKNWDGIEPNPADKAKLQQIQDEEELRQAQAFSEKQRQELRSAFYSVQGAKGRIGFLSSLPTPPAEELAQAQKELQSAEANLQWLQDYLTPEEKQLAMVEEKFRQEKRGYDDLLISVKSLPNAKEWAEKGLEQLKLSNDSAEAKADFVRKQEFFKRSLQETQKKMEEAPQNVLQAKKQFQQAQAELEQAQALLKSADEGKQSKLYWEKVYKKEIVSKGCLIFQGKYVRPPYVVELKNNKIVLNGTVIDFCSQCPPRLVLQQFYNHIRTLGDGGVEIGDERGLAFRSGVPRGEIRGLLIGIDDIVKSNETDGKKLDDLRKLKLSSDSLCPGCRESTLLSNVGIGLPLASPTDGKLISAIPPDMVPTGVNPIPTLSNSSESSLMPI